MESVSEGINILYENNCLITTYGSEISFKKLFKNFILENIFEDFKNIFFDNNNAKIDAIIAANKTTTYALKSK